MWLQVGRAHAGALLRGGRRRGHGIRVLVYHGIVERKTDRRLERNFTVLTEFRRQIRYLSRFRFVGFDEVMARLEGSDGGGKPGTLVTFDDGYANNQVAAEILDRERIPWCLFVPAGELGEHRTMWLVELSLLILRGSVSRLEALGRVWRLEGHEGRAAVFEELRAQLKKAPAVTRRETMTEIRSQFPPSESDRLLEQFPSLRLLTWRELAELAAGNVEVGSHGYHHEIQHADQPKGVRQEELEVSKRELEIRLGRSCRAFAFPNGDYVASSPVELAKAGYAAGFTTRAGTVVSGASAYLLPRLMAPSSFRDFVRSYWWA